MFQAPSPQPPITFQTTCLQAACSGLSCNDSLQVSVTNDILVVLLLQAAISAMYAKLLIILGLALPVSEVLSEDIEADFFNLFYVYLFLVSCLYLTMVYIDLLQARSPHKAPKPLIPPPEPTT